MKTNHTKLLLCLLLITLAKPWTAQVLILKGQIKDMQSRNMNGYYDLRHACNLLTPGRRTEVKLKPGPSRVYLFPFSKPGLQFKTIVVSAYVSSNYYYPLYARELFVPGRKHDVSLKKNILLL